MLHPILKKYTHWFFGFSEKFFVESLKTTMQQKKTCYYINDSTCSKSLEKDGQERKL